MTSPGSRNGGGFKRRRRTQFGFLRMLVWLSPGFTMAVIWILIVVKFGKVLAWLESLGALFWPLGVAVCLALVIPFGILDALLNPALPVEAGRTKPRALGKACLLFALGQILALPVVSAACCALVEMGGFRI